MGNFCGELDTMQIQINKDAYECCICENTFTSPVQLTVHCIIVHWLLPCTHCLKLFENEHLLDDHISRHHSTIQHICTDCSSSFTMQDEFFAHISLKHSKRLCAFCAQLILLSNYPKHVVDAHRSMNPSEMRLNIKTSGKNGFICTHCHDERSIISIDKLFFHYLYFHKYSLRILIQRTLTDNSRDSLKAPNCDAVANTNFKCSKCDLAYTLSTPKIYHNIYCHDAIYCQSCGNCFDTPAKFDRHLFKCKVSQNSLTLCDDCTFANGSIDETHIHAVHGIPATLQWTGCSSLLNTQNDCNFCGMNLSCEVNCLIDLLAHYRNLHKFNAIAILRYLKHNPIKKETVENENENQNSKKRSGKSAFTEIRVVDGGDVEYVMSFDSKTVKYVFSSESDYNSSDSEHAAGEAQKNSTAYKCDLCGSRFKSKFVHAMHMHKTHGFAIKTPEFRCNVCKKNFASNRSLKKHNRNAHHAAAPDKRFQCPFCEFRCNGKGRVRQHICEHVEASYHPCPSKAIGYNCRYCHFIFWTKEKLNQHQLSRHSGDLSESYLLCSLCYATFVNLVSASKMKS